MSPSAQCPCGTGTAYAGCCEPLLDGAPAPSAETLMRSRYTAFAVGDADHLFRSWHPRTRPDDVVLDRATTWLGLTVVRTEDGGSDDDTGVVEFEAAYQRAGVDGVQHETSRFERRRGRWVYVDASPDPAPRR